MAGKLQYDDTERTPLFKVRRNDEADTRVRTTAETHRKTYCEEEVDDNNDEEAAFAETNLPKWRSLLFGQWIALLASSMNAAAFTLNQHDRRRFPTNDYITTATVSDSTTTIDNDSNDDLSRTSNHLYFFPMIWVYLILALRYYWWRFRRRRKEKVRNLDFHDDGGHTGTNINFMRTSSHRTHIRKTAPNVSFQKIPWWAYYLVISFLDVVPNIMTLLALSYHPNVTHGSHANNENAKTTPSPSSSASSPLTSTTLLLGSLTVPATMFCCKIILHKVFGRYHVLGVALCVAGGCLTLWLDAASSTITTVQAMNASITSFDGDCHGTNHTIIAALSDLDNVPVVDQHQHFQLSDIFNVGFSDVLAVAAAGLYGLGDTVAEYSIKHVTARQEYLGMIGSYGCVFSVIGAITLEGPAVASLFWATEADMNSTDNDNNHDRLEIFGVLLWYVLSVVGYYVAEAKFLVRSDATLLNLSMQSCNMYAILAGIVLCGAVPPVTFYAAVFLVVAGVFCYELLGHPSSDDSNSNNGVKEQMGSCGVLPVRKKTIAKANFHENPFV